MIDTLPREVQNKIFYYVGGDVVQKDIRERIEMMRLQKVWTKFIMRDVSAFYRYPTMRLPTPLMRDMLNSEKGWPKTLWNYVETEMTNIDRERYGLEDEIGGYGFYTQDTFDYIVFCLYFITIIKYKLGLDTNLYELHPWSGYWDLPYWTYSSRIEFHSSSASQILIEYKKIYMKQEGINTCHMPTSYDKLKSVMNTWYTEDEQKEVGELLRVM